MTHFAGRAASMPHSAQTNVSFIVVPVICKARQQTDATASRSHTSFYADIAGGHLRYNKNACMLAFRGERLSIVVGKARPKTPTGLLLPIPSRRPWPT